MNSEEPQPDDVDDSDLPQQEKDEGDECDSSPPLQMMR